MIKCSNQQILWSLIWEHLVECRQIPALRDITSIIWKVFQISLSPPLIRVLRSLHVACRMMKVKMTISVLSTAFCDFQMIHLEQIWKCWLICRFQFQDMIADTRARDNIYSVTLQETMDTGTLFHCQHTLDLVSICLCQPDKLRSRKIHISKPTFSQQEMD